ncbi:hypothetical protein A0V43_08845 [Geobacillus sp. JS12]|nr:hypothetical protein A0V43_08845 [Geobacillus sp. JS12]
MAFLKRALCFIKMDETAQSKGVRRQKTPHEAGGKKQIGVDGVGGQICYEMIGQTCYNREEAQLR